MRFHHATVDQRRPVGHHLLHFGPATSKAGDARRTGEDEGRDLPGEALDRRLIASPHADAQLYLGDIRAGRPRQRPMGGIDAHILGEDLLELQT